MGQSYVLIASNCLVLCQVDLRITDNQVLMFRMPCLGGRPRAH